MRVLASSTDLGTSYVGQQKTLGVLMGGGKTHFIFGITFEVRSIHSVSRPIMLQRSCLITSNLLTWT